MTVTTPLLISHPLCPYVQRAVISLTEKEIAFERADIDLANKPEWFKAISPLGKTPVLKVGETAIFESAVIVEYLEETQPKPLHPRDPLRRAEHRSWMEFGSAALNEIAGLYAAPDETAFTGKAKALSEKFALLEGRLATGPYFDDDRFSLVDAVFGPVFRYFDVFDRIGGFRREVQPRRQHWFLNEKSGFPFRTPAFCSVSRRRRLGEKEYRAPSVTPRVALRPRTQGLANLASYRARRR